MPSHHQTSLTHLGSQVIGTISKLRAVSVHVCVRPHPGVELTGGAERSSTSKSQDLKDAKLSRSRTVVSQAL